MTASGVGCPSGAAEHRRENRGKLAPCLSVIERSEIASCASAGFTEKRRVSGHKSQIYARTSHRVPFSLGTFSWASKRKYLARKGETRREMHHKRKNLDPGLRRDDEIGIGAVSVADRSPATPPGMRVRTGRFEKLRS